MTILAIRQKVHQYIDTVDESIIRAIFNILKDAGKDEKKILKRLTIKEYNKSLALAEKEVASGKYLSHEDAVKEIRKW